MPQDPMRVIERIEKTLSSSGRPISINKLSKKTGLHYTTVKRYVTLLESMKKMQPIEVISGEGTTLVRLEQNISELPEEEQKKIIKTHFPELGEEGKFLIKLMGKNAVSKKTAIKVKKNDMVEKLLRLERLKKTKDGRVYLTELGYGIAMGAKKIYLE